MKEKRTIVTTLALTLMLALLTGMSLAQGPAPQGSAVPQDNASTAFTYQGRLKDAGSLVDNTCDFEFVLWDAASGGAQVGTTQTATSVAVSEGLFTVELDFGDDAFIGEAGWLGIAVRCPAGSGTYTSLSPRQPLTPAPYALSLRPGSTIYNTNSVGTTMGLLVASESGDGLEVFSGHDGVYMSYAGNSGIVVDSAGSHGIVVYEAGETGMRVGQAGTPSTTNSSGESNGFAVAGAEGYGLYVGRADADGVYVEEAGGHGVYAYASGSGNGVYGMSTSGHGVRGDAFAADKGGVYGYSLASGYGVYGHSSNGYGVYGSSDSGDGVVGEASTGASSAVVASHALTTGMALEIAHGGIKVKDAGFNTSTPVFVHTVVAWPPGNLCSIQNYATVIDHPLTNGRSDAILIVTPNYGPNNAGTTIAPGGYGVYYDATDQCGYGAGKWVIYNYDATPLNDDQRFNVLVVIP